MKKITTITWKKKYPEKKRALNRRWAELNREKDSAMKKAWLERNPEYKEVLRIKAVERRITHKDILKEQSKARYYANRDASIQKVVDRQKTVITPLWADKEKIAKIYAESRRITKETGIMHHVDHIVPVKGKTVCGLHVENNLQVMKASDNIRKFNHLLEGL